MMDIRRICMAAPVVPVIVIDDLAQAVPLARTLVAAGLPVLEVTLRTPAALAAIERIAAQVPGAIVGAGTIRRKADITEAANAGAVFGVSPGTPPALRDDIRASAMPFLPGCATVSEAMALHDAGFDVVKLFPAEAVVGRDLLRAIHAPLPDLAFCPTGGLTAASAPAYLALANVAVERLILSPAEKSELLRIGAECGHDVEGLLEVAKPATYRRWLA